MSLRSILMGAAGYTPPGGGGQEFTSQPAPGTNVVAKQSWKDKGLSLLLIPGINDSGGTMREYVRGLSPLVARPDFTTAPINPYVDTPNGRAIQLNPTNTDGSTAAIVEFPTSAITSNDLSFFWTGYVDDFTIKGGLLVGRGADLNGNGWSINLHQVNATTLRASYIDSSPARVQTDLTIPNTPVNTLLIAGWSKTGNVLRVWFGSAAQMGSITGGNGGLRSSTIGISISNGGDNRASDTAPDVNGRAGARTRCIGWSAFDRGISVADSQAIMANFWTQITT